MICGEALNRYLDVCDPCYTGLYRWNKRSVKQKIRRLDQLDRLERRLQFQLKAK
jgi:hypothetical protein